MMNSREDEVPSGASNDPIDRLLGELQEIRRRLDDGARRMDAMEQSIKDNTDITSWIRDAIAAAKVGFKVLGGLGLAAKWLGIVAGAATTVWGFISIIKSGGVPK